MRQKELSLNGKWQVATDQDLAGKAEGWHRAAVLLAQPHLLDIQVPCCLETYIEDFEGVAWFHKAFTLVEKEPGDCVRLHFEAVNYQAEVWLNDCPIGLHEGGYTDFEFEIGDLVLAGRLNHLIVRVITPLITRRISIDGIGYNETPHWRGAITGGIWQGVTLLKTGGLYLRHPFAEPDIHRQAARIRVQVHNGRKEAVAAQVRLSVTEEGSGLGVHQLTRPLKLLPGDTDVAFEVPIPHPRLWSPNQPNLYRADWRVEEGNSLDDEISFVFGMREFTVRGKSFYLNDQKILLKAAFYEGFYPYTLAYPQTPDMVKEEMRLAKEAGLNLLRPWRKPQPSIVYETADRMGMMMIGAIAVECMRFWPQESPAMQTRIKTDLQEMIVRDRNHAGIVMWEIFNEIHRQALKRLRHPMAMAARDLDESRMVLDESGGFFDGASVYLPGERTPCVIADVHFYPGAPVFDETYNQLLALGKTREEMDRVGLKKGTNTESLIVPDVLTNITELGYGSSPDLEAVMDTYAGKCNPITPDYRIHKRLYDSYQKVLRETEVLKEFGSLKAYCLAEQARHAAANKDMLEAARVNPQVGGIGIHAFVDGDWVVGAGMLDIHRRPKKAYEVMKQAFTPVYTTVRAQKRNYYAHEQPALTCHVVNDGPLRRDILRLKVFNEQGAKVFEHQQWAEAGETAVQLAPVSLGALPCGKYRAQASWGGAENESFFRVYAPRHCIRQTVAIYEPAGALRPLLEREGIAWREASDDSRVIYTLGPLTPQDGARLARWAEKGATVAVLQLPEGGKREADELILPEGLLPFPLRTIESFGYWTPNNHIVRKGHPLFAHLPLGMMDEDYQNISPRRSVRGQGHDWIVGMIGFGWWQDQMDKQNYTGVSEAFDAADVFFKSY